jgi:hypothetical protein
MIKGHIIGIMDKLKSSNDNALDFAHTVESALNDFEKTGNLSETHLKIKKAILDYKNKLIL